MVRQNQNGSVLIQSLIGIAVVGVMASVFASMMSQMNNQYNILARKLEAADLKTAVMTAMSQGDVCSWQLAGKNLTGLVGTIGVSGLSLPVLYSGSTAVSSPLAQTGELLPGTSANLRVSSIQFKNISVFSGPTSYQGQLEIDFVQGAGQAPMRPVALGLRVQTDSSLIVTSCLVTGPVTPPTEPQPPTVPTGGGPGSLWTGSCDGRPVPALGSGTPSPSSAADLADAKAKLCENINFPTPKNGEVSFKTSPCLKSATFGMSPADYAYYQIYKNYGIADGCPIGSEPKQVLTTMLGGLGSKEECEQIPSYPPGSRRIGGGWMTSTGYLCVGGRWIPYSFPASTTFY